MIDQQPQFMKFKSRQCCFGVGKGSPLARGKMAAKSIDLLPRKELFHIHDTSGGYFGKMAIDGAFSQVAQRSNFRYCFTFFQ